jgi:phospholipase/carboxylesterase
MRPIGTEFEVHSSPSLAVYAVTCMTYCALVEGSTHTADMTIVFLHGHGMSPEDFQPFAPAMRPGAACHFLRGPFEAIGGGLAWWPRDPCFAGLRGDPPWDLALEVPEGLDAARRMLAATLNDLRQRHPHRPLVLAGYSQGGMLASDTVLREAVRVDALALLSSCRIASQDWPPLLPRMAGMPVFIAHGDHDAVLSPTAGQALRDALAWGGARIDWLGFDGGHEVPLLVWRRLRGFLQSVAQAHQQT